ncbi:MAG: hypothetical protein ABIH23_20240 [bacterium]
MMRVRVFPLLAFLVVGVAASAWGQYGYGGGMGGGMMGPGGMNPYGFGGQGMYGDMGAQAPNFVTVKEGEAVYCAVFGDLIDYRVYPRQVPLDEIAGNYYDDGTHGDEVAFDGVPSNIEEDRDTYLGPFAIKYKNMMKKVLVDAVITAMNEGPFAMLEKARSQALLENRDILFGEDLDKEQFGDLVAELTKEVLEKEKTTTRDPSRIEALDQTIRLAQNSLLLGVLGDAKQALADRSTTRRKTPLEFYRIPVTAVSKESKLLVQNDTVNVNLTSKIEDWTESLLGQFIGPDGEPYDDEQYRFRLDVSILQNQQGLGMGGYGGSGYSGGGPGGMFAADRAREAASVAEEAGSAAEAAP